MVDKHSATGAGDASVLDFADRDPFDFYRNLREQGSPVWDDKAGAWLVLDYDQCVDIESSEEVFGNIYSDADPILAEVKGGQANLTFSQGELHQRLRRLHQAFLAVPVVEGYRDRHINPIINYVLDRIVDKGRAELVSDVAAQIPPRVICSLMGMPWEDDAKMARILELNQCIVDLVGANYQGDELRQRALDASHELNEALRPYVRDRRENPTDDLISRVWQEAPEAYGELTEDDAIAICRELYFAGSDTTVHGASNALYLVIADPEVRKRVGADRGKVKNAVEEGLRLYNVVQMRHRVAKQDTSLGGRDIKRGQLVLLVHAAANRDPAHYGECPANIDMDRRPAADHLAFGRGPRSCIGAPLARVEMREIVNTVLDRLPNVRIDPQGEQPRFEGAYMRHMGPLNVVWDV